MTRFIEDQTSIVEWNHSTFNGSPSQSISLQRTMDECVELSEAFLLHDLYHEIPGEIADVGICLAVSAGTLGITVYDLFSSIPAMTPSKVLLDLGIANLMHALGSGIDALEHHGHSETICFPALRSVRIAARNLSLVGACLGLSVPICIDGKMLINRQRKWDIKEAGIGKHQKDKKPLLETDPVLNRELWRRAMAERGYWNG